MKNNIVRKCLFALVLCAFSYGAYAQNESLIVKTDSLPSVLYDYLVSSTSKHFHDPSVPRFLIKDRSYNFVFGIGGYVQAIGYYDFNGMDNSAFVVGQIPVPTTGYGNTDVTNVSLGLTRLFFKVIGNTKHGMVNAYIETDFNGGSNLFRLRQAYIEYAGVTVGQSWTTFKDSESPNTLDPQGPVSMPDRRVPLIRYSYAFKNGISLAVSAEVTQTTQISMEIEDGKYDQWTVPQNIPDIPVSFQYTKGPIHLFAGLNTRLMKIPIDVRSFKNVFSFASQFSFRYDFLKSGRFTHTLYGQFIYSKGMVDCIQDLSGQGVNVLINDYMNVSIGSGLGFYGAYKMACGKSEFNVVYSQAQTIHLANCQGLYKRGDYLAGNYMRTIADHGKIGAEVVMGRRTNIGGEYGKDIHLNILVRYDF